MLGGATKRAYEASSFQSQQNVVESQCTRTRVTSEGWAQRGHGKFAGKKLDEGCRRFFAIPLAIHVWYMVNVGK